MAKLTVEEQQGKPDHGGYLNDRVAPFPAIRRQADDLAARFLLQQFLR